MKRDVFGQQGDFITSPEISQMFGEVCGSSFFAATSFILFFAHKLLAVWCIDAWQKLGEPTRAYLVEFGPGRGLLIRSMSLPHLRNLFLHRNSDEGRASSRKEIPAFPCSPFRSLHRSQPTFAQDASTSLGQCFSFLFFFFALP
jgi:hypothetical protein